MKAPGTHWYPIRIFRENARWLVDWCSFEGMAFADPFFHQTVQRALKRPFNRALRRVTPLAEVEDGNDAPTVDSLEPSGFVFHLSRCGSTLISQAFAALPDAIAISEAGAFDEILRASRHDPNVDDAWRIAHLRELVAIFGRRRRGNERALVIKFDAWHVDDLALIERAYPAVPWVFVAREPHEVMVSHRERPGWIMSAVNAPTLLKLPPAVAARLSPSERHARALAHVLDAVLAHESKRGRVVDYDELPDAIVTTIAPHFAIALDANDLEHIARATRFDTKNPSTTFESDRALKREAIDGEIADAVAQHLAERYRRLRARPLLVPATLSPQA